MPDGPEISIQILHDILRDVTSVDHLDTDQDFYEAGVTSVQALPLLMELESRFDISIPDDRFIQARSVRALAEMVGELRNG